MKNAMARAIVILMLLLTVRVSAQENGLIDLGGLNIGDAFGYPALNDVLNQPDHTLDLADFKGKLLILDFWGHGCASCVRAFPELDSLQRAFGDRIQIVAVNPEPREATIAYFDRLRRIAKPHFPIITADTLLHQLFPHALVPHHVWIDTAGVVRFITNGSSINEKTIREYFAGETPVLPEIRRVRQPGLANSPLLQLVQESNPRYSILYRAIPGVGAVNRIPFLTMNEGKAERITFSNVSAFELFEYAYSKGRSRYRVVYPEQCRFDGIDKDTFVRPAQDSLFNEWYTRYSYNYDIRVGDDQQARIYDYMVEDLNRYFKVEVRIFRKREDVYVLEVVDDALFASARKPMEKPERHLDSLTLRGWDADQIVAYFAGQAITQGFRKRFLNGVRFEDQLYLRIRRMPLSLGTMDKLNRELGRYGLGFVKRKRKMPRLEFRAL